MKSKYLVAVASVLMLGACVSKSDWGFSRQGPDENTVVTNSPLTLPPEYNLRPKKNELKLKDSEEDFDE